jgi:hypothetical protein
MLDDGLKFSLVPWRPVLDAHRGHELRALPSVRASIQIFPCSVVTLVTPLRGTPARQ